MFIAKEMGYFEDAGINMNIEIVEDESTYAALLVQGSVQFLATAQDPNIKMFANGAPSRYVLAMDASCGADGLVATADIQSLDDLAGKRVVTQAGSSALTALTEGDSVELAETFDSLEQTPDYNSAMLGLDSGLYDAVAIDIGVAMYYLNGGKAE